MTTISFARRPFSPAIMGRGGGFIFASEQTISYEVHPVDDWRARVKQMSTGDFILPTGAPEQGGVPRFLPINHRPARLESKPKIYSDDAHQQAASCEPGARVSD